MLREENLIYVHPPGPTNPPTSPYHPHTYTIHPLASPVASHRISSRAGPSAFRSSRKQNNFSVAERSKANATPVSPSPSDAPHSLCCLALVLALAAPLCCIFLARESMVWILGGFGGPGGILLDWEGWMWGRGVGGSLHVYFQH
jgi:hypothetical protein